MFSTIRVLSILAGLHSPTPAGEVSLSLEMNDPFGVIGVAVTKENFKSVVKENTINHRKFKEG